MARYCVYSIVSGFGGIKPPLHGGDTICVDCPADDDGTYVCPGPPGVNRTAIVRDSRGFEAKGEIRRQSEKCVTCPDGAKKGYVITRIFAAGEDDDDDEGCFFLALYASNAHPDVILLRGFRDHVLLGPRWGIVGRLVVRAYRRVSPPLAAVVSASGLIRAVTLLAFLPVIALVRRLYKAVDFERAWKHIILVSLKAALGEIEIRNGGVQIDFPKPTKKDEQNPHWWNKGFRFKAVITKNVTSCPTDEDVVKLKDQFDSYVQEFAKIGGADKQDTGNSITVKCENNKLTMTFDAYYKD